MRRNAQEFWRVIFILTLPVALVLALALAIYEALAGEDFSDTIEDVVDFIRWLWNGEDLA